MQLSSACALLQWTTTTLPHLRVAMTTVGNVLTHRHVAAVQNHDSSTYPVVGNGLMIVQSGIATVCGCGKAVSSDYGGFIVGKVMGKYGHALKSQGTVANHANIIPNSGDL